MLKAPHARCLTRHNRVPWVPPPEAPPGPANPSELHRTRHPLADYTRLYQTTRLPAQGPDGWRAPSLLGAAAQHRRHPQANRRPHRRAARERLQHWHRATGTVAPSPPACTELPAAAPPGPHGRKCWARPTRTAAAAKRSGTRIVIVIVSVNAPAHAARKRAGTETGTETGTERERKTETETGKRTAPTARSEVNATRARESDPPRSASSAPRRRRTRPSRTRSRNRSRNNHHRPRWPSPTRSPSCNAGHPSTAALGRESACRTRLSTSHTAKKASTPAKASTARRPS